MTAMIPMIPMPYEVEGEDAAFGDEAAAWTL